MGEVRNGYNNSVGKPEGKSPIVISHSRWNDIN
jgi:hypothetical protein